jgi:hypothetical protein
MQKFLKFCSNHTSSQCEHRVWPCTRQFCILVHVTFHQVVHRDWCDCFCDLFLHLPQILGQRWDDPMTYYMSQLHHQFSCNTILKVLSYLWIALYFWCILYWLHMIVCFEGYPPLWKIPCFHQQLQWYWASNEGCTLILFCLIQIVLDLPFLVYLFPPHVQNAISKISSN